MLSRRIFLKNGAFAFVSLGFAPSFLARTAFAPAELPIGAVTASIGAPLFAWLLLRNP